MSSAVRMINVSESNIKDALEFFLRSTKAGNLTDKETVQDIRFYFKGTDGTIPVVIGSEEHTNSNGS